MAKVNDVFLFSNCNFSHFRKLIFFFFFPIGVYCSPNIDTAAVYAGEATIEVVDSNGQTANKTYLVVFQVAVKPSKNTLDRSHPNVPDDYWIVKDPANIRPYGILLRDKDG